MIGTTVTSEGEGVGGTMSAFTGLVLGPLRLGFVDTMEITGWDPPHECQVRHTGRLVRGDGTFIVHPRGPHASMLVWVEDLDLPLGLLGRLGWPLVRPVLRAAVLHSLRRFARWVPTM
jgi:hypothetical protein